MHHYWAFGLNIASEVPLPELRPGDANCDVTIRVTRNRQHHPTNRGPNGWRKLTRQDALLSIEQVGLFQLQNGTTVHVSCASEASETLLQLYLQGVVMAVLLYQRGKLVLHASCVEIDGRAVAFLGESGWGKSSLAAALITRGHRLIADDIAAITLDSDCASVARGLPLLKLNADVAAALGLDSAGLIFLDAAETKRGLRAQQPDDHRALPLARVYVLAPGAGTLTRALPPQQAFFDLVRHSYPTRLRHPSDSAHFMQCAELARRVPILGIGRSAALAGLSDLATLVEAEMLAPAIELMPE